MYKKRVFFEQKKIKLMNEWHFVVNKADFVVCFKKCSKFTCCLNTENKYLGVFSFVRLHM